MNNKLFETIMKVTLLDENIQETRWASWKKFCGEEGADEADTMVKDGSISTRNHPQNPKLKQYRLTVDSHKRVFTIELEAMIRTQCEADDNTYQLWWSS